MKKILSTIIFLPILLAGCMKLDFVPSDALTGAALATNPAAAEYTTDGIYSMMKDMSSYQNSQNNSFVRQYFLLNELKTDNICYSNTSTDPFWKAAQFIDDETTPNNSYMWYICYKMIYAANSNISGLTEDTKESRQLKGENHFLRAFFHFTLTTLFAKPYGFDQGASPGIVLRIGTDYSETKRSTVAECYDAIEDDLKEAIRLMSPGYKRGNNGYATQEAAHALLGRLYLYKEDWDACIAECDAILGDNPNSHLESEVTTLYSTAPTSKEVLWCVDITDTDIANMPPKGNLASMFDSPDGTQNTGWGELYLADPLHDLFQRFPQDKRYKDIIRLHASVPGLLVYWTEMDEGSMKPVIAYPDVTFNKIDTKEVKNDFGEMKLVDVYEVAAVTSCVTANADGSYSFTYDGKALKAIPDNTASKICDEFPGYILNDGSNTRCYVRQVMPTAIATNELEWDDEKKKKEIVSQTPTAVWDGSGCSIRGAGGQFLCWFSEKFSHQTNLTYPISSSFIMLRYAEVILNRAEAYAHKGTVDKALADINVIRTRAGLTGAAQMSAGNLAGRGYSDIVDAVLDERRMEFYYEGLRLQDLIRNKRDIDRRFLNFAKAEVIPYNDLRIQYQIPMDETRVSGIAPNPR
jgi:hypothetical protein